MNRIAMVVWILVDGKPGHESQSLGLAEAIARRTPAEIHRIRVASGALVPHRCRAAAKAAANLPRPALIVSAGHATHLPLLWLAREYRTRSIVLMRPSLPLSWFDLCIAPEHDFPNGCSRPNVILTRGSLNRVTPGDGDKHGRLILVGGPSKTHGWDGAALMEMLAAITADGWWELTDSRRTPADFLRDAIPRLPGVAVFSHDDTPDGWVSGKLVRAKEVWVTEDSVSMIYEALSSGARVGLLPMPRKTNRSRVVSGIERLIDDGYITPYQQWSADQSLTPPSHPLREADRCAELLLASALARRG